MSPPAPSAALAAFLRGIEPRARILARAHVGPDLDDAALLDAVRVRFVALAAGLPLAEWPLRYWCLLLAREELEQAGGALPMHPLYGLSHALRLALLLRLVVGLEPAGAAKVMGVSEPAYRALRTEAEDHLAGQGIGPAVLQHWQTGFQQEVRMGTTAAPQRPVAPAVAVQRARPWRPTALQGLLAVTAVLLLTVFAATFVWPPTETAVPARGPSTSPTALAAAPAPDARRDFDADLVTDPDFSLLASSPTAAWREGVAFLSWRVDALGFAIPPPAPASPPPVRAWSALPVDVQVLLVPVRAAWPALDGEAQAELFAQAEVWRGLGLAERARLRAAYTEWLARPALERSALRAAYAEWHALEAGEQAVLAEAAAHFAALPLEQRTAERAAFQALDASVREDWVRGPRLGRQLPGLRPLLLHLPAAEQAELIAIFEALDESGRSVLAERLAAMGAAERAALRGRVLAVPATERLQVLATEASVPMPKTP